MTSYTFQRGDTITVGLEAFEGAADLIGITAVAKMRRADREVLVLTFDTHPGVDFLGWIFMAPSRNLTPGDYLMDAEITLVGGSPIVTDPIMIRIEPSASALS